MKHPVKSINVKVTVPSSNLCYDNVITCQYINKTKEGYKCLLGLGDLELKSDGRVPKPPRCVKQPNCS